MLTIFLINCFLVLLTVFIHYGVLLQLAKRSPLLDFKQHTRILIGVIGGLIAHAIEVWIFAVAYFLMSRSEQYGTLAGDYSDSLLDCGYFSFVTYTTVGYGDIFPLGPLRYTAAIESLTGLVLITWTASFLFLEMQRHWKEDK